MRRTDKIKLKEAEFIPNSVYWKAVTAAEKQVVQNGTKRKKDEKLKVYIASEDVKVLPEFRKTFKGGEFLGPITPNGKSLENTAARHLDLFSIVRDIWILYQCDFVVVTFSSNVSKLSS